MSEIDDFIHIIRDNTNNGLPLTIEQARLVIKELNTFLYTTHEDLGNTEILGKNYEYFSSFHKYWEEHHQELLNLQISEENCEAVARALHDVYLRTNGRAFQDVYDTNGLNNEDICRVRFLTANQDFRGSRDFLEFAHIFEDDHAIFDEHNIVENPESFITSLNLQGLAQNDKRINFARNAARFLINHNCSPFEIINCFNRDVFAFRQALINCDNAGYGDKKTDMFIRDMVVLNIWPIENIRNFDRINVASDVNTIKVALRTGILTSEIPLLSSFLDIFGYQYNYVDEQNAAAWRRVFELWNQIFPEETIASPCLLDYFIYNVVGRQFCQEKLYVFRGENCEHVFKWHSPQNRTCQECYRQGIRHNHAFVIEKRLPCNDNDGNIAIQKTDFYRSGIADPNYDECPFKQICDDYNHKKLQPPKSISITGKTGWTSGYSKPEEGGGGIMS